MLVMSAAQFPDPVVIRMLFEIILLVIGVFFTLGLFNMTIKLLSGSYRPKEKIIYRVKEPEYGEVTPAGSGKTASKPVPLEDKGVKPVGSGKTASKPVPPEALAQLRKSISDMCSETLMEYADVMISPETLLYRPIMLSVEDPQVIASEKAVASLRDIADQARRSKDISELRDLHVLATVHVDTWKKTLKYADNVGIPVIDPKKKARIMTHIRTVLDERATLAERELHLDRLTALLSDVHTKFYGTFTPVAQTVYLQAVMFAKEQGELPHRKTLALEK